MQIPMEQPMATPKSREIGLRRRAPRCGYRLAKCARRDPNAIGYGLDALVSVETGEPVNPPLVGTFPHSWTLDQVEAHLEKPTRRRKGDHEQRVGQ
jgi:hypothetical protein